MTVRVATWPSGTRVSWRSPSWGEYKEVNSFHGPPAERAQKLYELIKIDGPSIDRVPAGIPMWLLQYEMENSAFSGTFQALSQQLEQFRNKVRDTYLLSAQAYIASVFKVPFEKMDEWDSDTFLTRLAQAELVSGSTLNPMDPQASKSRNSKVDAKRPKKPLTPTQQKVVDNKFGAGTSERYNADQIRNSGSKPSQQTNQDVENFTYTK